MSWTRLDDRLWAHPKLGDLDPALALECVGLWALALSWSGDLLTDGFIPRYQPVRLAGRPVDNLIDELVRAGLWDRDDKGYVIHDYLEYNPSKAQVLAVREAKSEAGKRGAATRWHGGVNGTSHNTHLTAPMAKRWQNDAPVPVPIEEEEDALTRVALEEIPKSESTAADYRKVIDKHRARLSEAHIQRIILQLAEWKPKKPRAKLHRTLDVWLLKEEPEARGPTLGPQYPDVVVPEGWL